MVVDPGYGPAVCIRYDFCEARVVRRSLLIPKFDLGRLEGRADFLVGKLSINAGAHGLQHIELVGE